MSIADKVDSYLENEYTGATSTIYRDLSLNFKKIMTDSPLDEMERHLSLLAIAVSLKNVAMIVYAEAGLRELGATDELILEAKESAAIMGMLNTYYKFKNFLPTEVLEHYSRAGLRMQSLSKPINGKVKFEQMAFSVSVVNGCQSCVASHENALAGLGVDREKIHDLARLAAVSKGLAALSDIKAVG